MVFASVTPAFLFLARDESNGVPVQIHLEIPTRPAVHSNNRQLLDHLETKAAWLRRFDVVSDQAAQEMKQTSTLMEKKLKDLVEEAEARPMASILAELQEAAEKEASTFSVWSDKEECLPLKPSASSQDVAVAYWISMGKALARHPEDERHPEHTNTSVPSLANFNQKLSNHVNNLNDQIKRQRNSLLSLVNQFSSHQQQIDNVDQFISWLMAKNMRLVEEIAESQKLKTERAKELRRLNSEVERAGDTVVRETKQVRLMLASYEPEQATSGATENGHNGDSNIYVDPMSSHREETLQDAYFKLQQMSFAVATKALQKKSGAVAKAAKLIMSQGNSFKDADVCNSCSQSRAAFEELRHNQKQTWRLAEQKVQGKTFAEWLAERNLILD